MDSQIYDCPLTSARGEVLNASIKRSLSESIATLQRSSFSSFLIGNSTGVEAGNGNLDVLLRPYFGRSVYGLSSTHMTIENQFYLAAGAPLAELSAIPITEKSVFRADSSRLRAGKSTVLTVRGSKATISRCAHS